MPIGHAQHICGHTIAGTAEREFADRLIQIVRVMVFEPCIQRSLFEWRRRREHSTLLLDVRNGFGIRYNFDEAQPMVGADTAVRIHAKIVAMTLPYFIHHT